MYLSYWGLGESPFRASLDARFFLQGPSQDEALARLHFLVDERRALGLLLSAPGCGKSMLLETFARQLPPHQMQRALVSIASIDVREFQWLVGGQLGVEISAHCDGFTLGRTLVDHLLANRYQQLGTVLLLDDADEAKSEVLDEVARLAQLNADRDVRLTIVLAAQPARLARLGARLLNLAELRIDLEGWEADETASFVKRALAVAGRSTPVFSESALARLHEQSGGIPRRVKQLADLALLAGAGQNLAQVEPETIDSVARELGVTTGATAGVAAARR
ncbi:MAG: ExeA family protein [Pirellulales bacterium]